MKMKKNNYMLEIDTLRNSSRTFLGVLMGSFFRVWVSKKTPRRPAGYLYKTMISTARPPPPPPPATEHSIHMEEKVIFVPLGVLWHE